MVFSETLDNRLLVIIEDISIMFIEILQSSALSYVISIIGESNFLSSSKKSLFIFLNLFSLPIIILSGFNALLSALPKMRVST